MHLRQTKNYNALIVCLNFLSYVSEGEALQKDVKNQDSLNVDHNQSMSATQSQPSKPKRKATTTTRKTVSACSKPKRQAKSKTAAVSYDSDTEEDEEIEATVAKRAKPLSQ